MVFIIILFRMDIGQVPLRGERTVLVCGIAAASFIPLFWGLFLSWQVQHRAQSLQPVFVFGGLHGRFEQPLLSAVRCVLNVRTTQRWRSLERGHPQTGKRHRWWNTRIRSRSQGQGFCALTRHQWLVMYNVFKSVLCALL